jgi:hypothetical protein
MLTQVRRPALGRAATLALWLVAGSGCNTGPLRSEITGATVKGTVRYQGKPVTGGTVRLTSVTDDNKSMMGMLLSNGTYEVPNAPLGEVKIVVETDSAKFDRTTMLRQAKPEGLDLSKLPPPMKFVPIDPKYSDPAKTPLRMTVGKGEQTFDIEMP